MKSVSSMSEENKKALVVAFYLSKFDRDAVSSLGYKTFRALYDGIGKILNVKPMTIKQMRDQFDPYCSKVRVGWYQREIIRSRLNTIEAYDELSQLAMYEIVRIILSNVESDTKEILAPIDKVEDGHRLLLSEDNPYATRIRTGDKAEQVFIDRFKTFSVFSECALEDTRKFGIGFDFKANYNASYWAIEVKGVNEEHGLVSFTDKEWSVAKLLGNSYYLALVRSLRTDPSVDLIRNPGLSMPLQARTSKAILVNWIGRV